NKREIIRTEKVSRFQIIKHLEIQIIKPLEIQIIKPLEIQIIKPLEIQRIKPLEIQRIKPLEIQRIKPLEVLIKRVLIPRGTKQKTDQQVLEEDLRRESRLSARAVALRKVRI